LNRHAPFYETLKKAASSNVNGGGGGGGSGVCDDPELYEDDAKVTWENGQDFERRSAQINATTEALVGWLLTQTETVAEVFYPSLTQRGIYDAYKRPGGGYGGLFSVSLKEVCSPTAFYDALDVYKGPSLGTNFTLACPYTLLAHYHELDFARAHGVCPNLVRVSVGMEPLERLKKAFGVALEASKAPLPQGVEHATYFPPGLRV
jgi:cystathionine gamma-synthase